DALSAPGEAAEADGGGGDSVAIVAAVESAADDGKGPGPRLDGEVQFVDDRPEQRARAEDLDLGIRGCLLAEDAGEVVESRDALRLVLHLEQDVGAIGWRGKEQVEDCQNNRRGGNRSHEHAILDDGPD